MLQSTNLANAKRNLENNTKELEVLKDFTTTTEVRPAWDTLNHLNIAVDILSRLSLRKPAG